MQLASVGSPLLWVGFIAFVLVMLALDLGVFHRQSHRISSREAAIWSAVWITLSLVFNGIVYHWFGTTKALEYLTGYVIEKALSVDNLFVFLIIFRTFAVPLEHQHRVLFWGIIGALALRALFIFAGAALLDRFHFTIYVFGAILVYTGLKLFRSSDDEVHPENNPLFRVFRRLVPATSQYHGSHFTVLQAGRRLATPLLLVLVAVEASDIVFAVDSIPAIFAVTTDPFIVFTSNIFAILGLRSLFFLLANAMEKLRYLKTGLAFVLTFVGVKMLVSQWYKVPIPLSLGVITGTLTIAVVVSLLKARQEERAAHAAGNGVVDEGEGIHFAGLREPADSVRGKHEQAGGSADA